MKNEELEELSLRHTVFFYKNELLLLVTHGLKASGLTITDIRSLKRWGAVKNKSWGTDHQYVLTEKALEALGRREQPHRYPEGRTLWRDSRGRFTRRP